MKKLRKTNNIKSSKNRLQAIIFFAIFGIIAFLLQMRPIAEKVSEWTGFDSEKVQEIAEQLFRLALTIVLVLIAFILFPVVGILGAFVALIGLAISVPVVMSYFPDENEKM